MPQIAEGVATTMAIHQLTERRGLKLPIINLIYEILFEGLPASQVQAELGKLAESHYQPLAKKVV